MIAIILNIIGTAACAGWAINNLESGRNLRWPVMFGAINVGMLVLNTARFVLEAIS